MRVRTMSDVWREERLGIKRKPSSRQVSFRKGRSQQKVGLNWALSDVTAARIASITSDIAEMQAFVAEGIHGADKILATLRDTLRSLESVMSTRSACDE